MPTLSIRPGGRALLGAVLILGLAGAAGAHGLPPASLRGIKVPRVPGLLTGPRAIVVNARYARALGKALFWDAAVGSDGMACASCHFHAGADRRTRNQLNPGTAHRGAASGLSFEPLPAGLSGGPDYELRQADFPLYRHLDPSQKSSPVLFETDDAVGSAGSFLGDFEAVSTAGSAVDVCATAEDPLFHWQGRNTRRVTDRNAPTVINAAFNHRNFWDGRANNLFNGESPWGVRDRGAGAWVARADGAVLKRPLALINASLASQAVAPPVNDAEMSCRSRGLADIGAKLLDRRALEIQAVAPRDSLLGRFVDGSGLGLRLSYRQLIRKAFARRYWNGQGDFGQARDGRPYAMMEANFALYFGLAIMLYEDTLVSDQAPYDTPRDAGEVPKGLDVAQRRGLSVFLNAHCQNCHNGPTFSAAANPFLARNNGEGPLLVDRATVDGAAGNDARPVLRDVGFTNTSVTPDPWDVGLGGSDPWGGPLAFATQYVNALTAGQTGLIDPVVIRACEFESPFTTDWPAEQLRDDPDGLRPGRCRDMRDSARLPTAAALARQLERPDGGQAGQAVRGAFKIPTLRNVELTGPFMHNGGMSTLEQVVAFYNRGGNLTNPAHFSTFVFPQGLSSQEQADLVAFLKSLTDERVRWERAPFDHPGLTIPAGGGWPTRGNPGSESRIVLPAVGRHGRSLAQGPLRPFAEFLPP